ncbi:hypothetical protein CPB84DRAFT_1786750, partial [Gymnopilus junonius]
MLFAPCEGFNSSRVLLSRVRGPERTAAAVGLPSGMSAQPDIPIFISTPPPSWVGGFLAHAEVKPLHSAFSRAGRVRRVALVARMPYGTSIYPDMPISFISPPPLQRRDGSYSRVFFVWGNGYIPLVVFVKQYRLLIANDCGVGENLLHWPSSR